MVVGHGSQSMMGPSIDFELSYNEPSYCADLEEQKKSKLQELEITKMDVSSILVV